MLTWCLDLARMNSKLQGLAVAILKLWERSVIVKIAVKWGVQNTNNELMASELKHLTGGVLILRNKFFIILYRGKDFLPGNLANMVVERCKAPEQWHLHEEDARLKAAGILDLDEETSTHSSMTGTFSEYQHIQEKLHNPISMRSDAEAKIGAEKPRLMKELKAQEYKLAILKFKIEKAEQELLKLNSAWKPSEEEADQELITEEERECFKKMGLKMDHALVLGKRGVFDGVMEGLHQHWKHRELVKVITMQKTSLHIVYTARLLERESGDVLVSIDKLKNGHTIIIYGGKNYKCPVGVGDNLLKKKALKKSLQKQSLGVNDALDIAVLYSLCWCSALLICFIDFLPVLTQSLKFFAYQRGKEIADLRLKWEELEKNKKDS